MAINDYATLSEVQASLPDITNWATVYNTFITRLITAASRLTDKKCNFPPGGFAVTADSTLYYDAPGPNMYPAVQGWINENRLSTGIGVGPARRVWIDMLASVTSVSITPDGNLTNFVALAATDYILGPYNAAAWGEPYRWIDLDIVYGKYQTFYGFRKGVKVVGAFGWSVTPPDDIKQTVIIQAARWFKRGQQMYQDLAVISDNAQTVYTKLDNDLAETVAAYRRMAV